MIGKKYIKKIPKGLESLFKKKKFNKKAITKTVNKFKKPIKAKTKKVKKLTKSVAKKVKKAIKNNPKTSIALGAGASFNLGGAAGIQGGKRREQGKTRREYYGSK